MDKIGFGTLNSIVLAIYLLAMLAIGVYFTKKAGESTDEFFKAGGNIPSWAVGFSIYATTLSASRELLDYRDYSDINSLLYSIL